MDKAKAAISDFMGRSGHHDTTVHESVAPAVQHETVKPHQHENINTAIDKEIHQDHYHRTVQPVHDREVLPETHEAKLGAVQHREFDHRDHDTTKRNLVQDQAHFKDERRVEGTTSSRSVAPTVGGEHIHHHIHETIQPVVHKETIQPNVVHTTVPIHEVHHNKATHHDSTTLPAMTMDQFKSQGGALTGREERYDEFKGVPKNLGGGTAGGLGAVRGMEHTSGHHARENAEHGGLTTNTTTQGLTGHSTTGGMTGHHEGHHHNDRGVTGSSTTGGLTGHHDNQHHTSHTGGLTGSNIAGNPTGSSTSGGLTGHDQHHHADRGTAGQGNLTGSSTQGGVVSSGSGHHDHHDHTSAPTDRNAGRGTGHHADGVVEGVAGTGKNELTHLQGEDGSLPKALTEDKSKAVPHSKLKDDQHSTGHNTHDHNTTGDGTQKKASLMDKLNPKVDSNGDGKAGFMK